MNNFKMTLQYDGTRYLGWTKNEKSVKTVSYKLEQVLTRLLGQPVTLHAAVRTEPCVHASCQVCSFEADLPFSPEVLKKQMNQYLPWISKYFLFYRFPDVSVRISESVLILTNTMSARLRFMMYSIPDIRLIFFLLLTLL